MALQLIIITLLFKSIVSIKTGPEENFYNVAVVEYCPLEGIDGNETVWKNGLEYIRLIRKAAETVDIVVFPETALNFEDITVYMDVPFGTDSVAPADNSSLHPVLRMLSKAARDNQVYVSVCVLEKDDTSSKEVLRYNTNVVFDRTGKIVSRYRKTNLYQENHLNVTKVPEIAFFDSDFGVRFGVFICADIFFKYPALILVREKNITDFIYPSWSFAELPFATSIQFLFGWAYMTDSNLLASGLNSLGQGSTGSGVFEGKKGPVVYIYNERNETRILTAKLIKKGKIGKSEGKILEPLSGGVDSTFETEAEDFQFYKTHLLEPPRNDFVSTGSDSSLRIASNKIINKTICQSSLCCEFSINATYTYLPQEYLDMSDISYIKNDSYYHYQYRLATFDGVRGFPNSTSTGIQVCAIIPCLNESLTSCGQKTGNNLPLRFNSQLHGAIFLHSTAFSHISIKATTKEKTDFTFPSILVSSKNPSPKAFGAVPDVSKLDFNYDGYSSLLDFSSDRLIYVALYSRIVSRDGQKVGVWN